MYTIQIFLLVTAVCNWIPDVRSLFISDDNNKSPNLEISPEDTRHHRTCRLKRRIKAA